MATNQRLIDTSLLERLYLAITSLMQCIEATRPGNTLRWFADGKTPVISLPDFGYAREAAAELEPLLASDYCDASNKKSFGKTCYRRVGAYDFKPKSLVVTKIKNLKNPSGDEVKVAFLAGGDIVRLDELYFETLGSGDSD